MGHGKGSDEKQQGKEETQSRVEQKEEGRFGTLSPGTIPNQTESESLWQKGLGVTILPDRRTSRDITVSLATSVARYRLSVQLSEKANAHVLNGLPSRSLAHGRPTASIPFRKRRAPRAGTRTVHTP